MNIYIFQNINLRPLTWTIDFTLGNSLFGVGKLTKNDHSDKYKYSGHGIGFDSRESFTSGNGFSKNVIVFGAKMSWSVHVHNIKQNSW